MKGSNAAPVNGLPLSRPDRFRGPLIGLSIREPDRNRYIRRLARHARMGMMAVRRRWSKAWRGAPMDLGLDPFWPFDRYRIYERDRLARSREEHAEAVALGLQADSKSTPHGGFRIACSSPTPSPGRPSTCQKPWRSCCRAPRRTRTTRCTPASGISATRKDAWLTPTPTLVTAYSWMSSVRWRLRQSPRWPRTRKAARPGSNRRCWPRGWPWCSLDQAPGTGRCTKRSTRQARPRRPSWSAMGPAPDPDSVHGAHEPRTGDPGRQPSGLMATGRRRTHRPARGLLHRGKRDLPGLHLPILRHRLTPMSASPR